MKIFSLKPLSMCDTNSYLVVSDSSNCVLIDAPDDADYIIEQINLLGLTLKKIFLTHGHFDHVGAVADLVEETGCEVYIHKNDLPKLMDGDGGLSRFFGAGSIKKVSSAVPFTEDDVLTLDELEFDVLHTPGHTSGSCCFIIGCNMFSGDTLFRLSVGRTDLPDGDHDVLMDSLRKINDLAGDLKIFPGHMKTTTLDYERNCNPYLRHLGDR